jgi:calpain
MDSFSSALTTGGNQIFLTKKNRRYYTELFSCINFPDRQGKRLASEWKGDSAGGLPNRGTPAQIKSWVKNPQTLVTITNDSEDMTQLFISLGQQDGRLKASEASPFPFTQHIHPIIILVIKLEDSEKLPLTNFDPKKYFFVALKNPRIVGQTKIRAYRDIFMDLS